MGGPHPHQTSRVRFLSWAALDGSTLKHACPLPAHHSAQSSAETDYHESVTKQTNVKTNRAKMSQNMCPAGLGFDMMNKGTYLPTSLQITLCWWLFLLLTGLLTRSHCVLSKCICCVIPLSNVTAAAPSPPPLYVACPLPVMKTLVPGASVATAVNKTNEHKQSVGASEKRRRSLLSWQTHHKQRVGRCKWLLLLFGLLPFAGAVSIIRLRVSCWPYDIAISTARSTPSPSIRSSRSKPYSCTAAISSTCFAIHRDIPTTSAICRSASTSPS